MNTKTLLVATLLAGTTSLSMAQTDTTTSPMTDTDMVSTGTMSTPGEVSNKTRTFMEKAATSGKLEVRLGEIAQQKANSQEVKDFGQQMVTDHSQANEKLKSLAQQKGVTLPDSLTAKQQQQVDKLSKLSGQEFDKEYMDMMVKDHNKDIKTFEKASQNVPDPAVQDFASQTLPTLKDHLQEAKDINQQMRSS